ncbi:galactose-1-phosphate uridylyltransferase [bacterium]|nr:MAG: galactose-1-phosphate uridylyltransferase [bacterium]
MPEMRLNLVTRDWVIIATERAKKPEDFKRAEARPFIEPYVEACPFCAGNEAKTAAEKSRLRDDGGWRVRVVANKYPAVAAEGEKKRVTDGVKRMVSGVGLHEIIIESPLHNSSPALMELRCIEDVVRVYKERFLAAYADARVEHVIIFKNYGASAGTSLEHPHTQLIGIPVVPVKFRDRVQAAMHYFDDTGSCMMCDMIKMELKDGRRVVVESDYFLSFIPYASLSPFHIWILPKRHSATFADITEAEIQDFARQLKETLLKFYIGLDDPDYNYVIRSSRPADAGNVYSHWYLSIIPRLSSVAGFELGSGIYLNASVPEETAPYLKGMRG